MKVLLMTLVASVVVAASGFPTHDVEASLLTLRNASPSSGAATLVVQSTARWSESGSLLLLAAGLFGASAILRRRSCRPGKSCFIDLAPDGSTAALTSAQGIQCPPLCPDDKRIASGQRVAISPIE